MKNRIMFISLVFLVLSIVFEMFNNQLDELRSINCLLWILILFKFYEINKN